MRSYVKILSFFSAFSLSAILLHADLMDQIVDRWIEELMIRNEGWNSDPVRGHRAMLKRETFPGALLSVYANPRHNNATTSPSFDTYFSYKEFCAFVEKAIQKPSAWKPFSVDPKIEEAKTLWGNFLNQFLTDWFRNYGPFESGKGRAKRYMNGECALKDPSKGFQPFVDIYFSVIYEAYQSFVTGVHRMMELYQKLSANYIPWLSDPKKVEESLQPILSELETLFNQLAPLQVDLDKVLCDKEISQDCYYGGYYGEPKKGPFEQTLVYLLKKSPQWKEISFECYQNHLFDKESPSELSNLPQDHGIFGLDMKKVSYKAPYPKLRERRKAQVVENLQQTIKECEKKELPRYKQQAVEEVISYMSDNIKKQKKLFQDHWDRKLNTKLTPLCKQSLGSAEVYRTIRKSISPFAKEIYNRMKCLKKDNDIDIEEECINTMAKIYAERAQKEVISFTDPYMMSVNRLFVSLAERMDFIQDREDNPVDAWEEDQKMVEKWYATFQKIKKEAYENEAKMVRTFKIEGWIVKPLYKFCDFEKPLIARLVDYELLPKEALNEKPIVIKNIPDESEDVLCEEDIAEKKKKKAEEEKKKAILPSNHTIQTKASVETSEPVTKKKKNVFDDD